MPLEVKPLSAFAPLVTRGNREKQRTYGNRLFQSEFSGGLPSALLCQLWSVLLFQSHLCSSEAQKWLNLILIFLNFGFKYSFYLSSLWAVCVCQPVNVFPIFIPTIHPSLLPSSPLSLWLLAFLSEAERKTLLFQSPSGFVLFLWTGSCAEWDLLKRLSCFF